jgi:hypothetical protein
MRRTLRALAVAGLTDPERLREADLLAIDGIGPCRAEAIRRALEASAVRRGDYGAASRW